MASKWSNIDNVMLPFKHTLWIKKIIVKTYLQKMPISACVVSCISGVPLYICNDDIYGFVMVPLEQSDSLQLDFMQLTNLKLEVLGMHLYNAFL